MHHEKQFCGVFFEFGSVVQEMTFKRILIWSLGSPPVWCSRTIYAILKDGIMGNIYVKLYGFGPVVQKEMSIKDISYLEL